MRKNNPITLTSEELQALTDDIKFRERVLIQLKMLNGIPQKVVKLEIHSAIHWALLILILSGILGLTWRVLAK